MSDALEARIEALGRQIFTGMEKQSPSVFNKDFWSGKMMEWSMKDEAFKIQMFRFVDVFAGTGVIGMEALSRGATRCLFVEKDARLISNIEKHLARFGVGLRSDILKVDAYRWAEQFLAPQEPTLIFISPPFPDFEARPDDLHKLVENLTKVLVPGSMLVLQAEEHDNLPRVAVGDDWDMRKYGRNQLWIRRIPGLEEDEPTDDESATGEAPVDETAGNNEEN